MSKFIFGIALLTLLTSFVVSAESDYLEIEEEVLTSFKGLVQASKDLDSQRYFEYFDGDKFVGLNSDGTNWNSITDLDPIIKNGFASIEKIIRLDFTNIKISVIDQNTAVLVNEYVQSMELKTGKTVNSAGGGTQVWSRQSGVWKIVSVSASNKF